MTLNLPLLESTFQDVIQEGDAFIEKFYANLFIYAPELRSMFRQDLVGQRAKLHMSLVTILQALEDIDSILIPYLRHLGVKHQSFHVIPEHYGAFSEVMLQTLQHFLGDKWQPNVEQTWRDALQLITEKMQDSYQLEESNLMNVSSG